jgi:hypothetical protein
VDIQKNQIGLQGFDAVKGLLAVLSFAADGEGVRAQKGADRVSRDVMIVNEEYSRRKSPGAWILGRQRVQRADRSSLFRGGEFHTAMPLVLFESEQLAFEAAGGSIQRWP